MSGLAGCLLAVAAVLVSLARRTAGRPPLWRSKVSLAGAIVCLVLATVLTAAHPSVLVDTPVLFAVALCLFEATVAVISLRAARAIAPRRPRPIEAYRAAPRR